MFNWGLLVKHSCSVLRLRWPAVFQPIFLCKDGYFFFPGKTNLIWPFEKKKKVTKREAAESTQKTRLWAFQAQWQLDNNNPTLAPCPLGEFARILCHRDSFQVLSKIPQANLGRQTKPLTFFCKVNKKVLNISLKSKAQLRCGLEKSCNSTNPKDHYQTGDRFLYDVTKVGVFVCECACLFMSVWEGGGWQQIMNPYRRLGDLLGWCNEALPRRHSLTHWH